MSKLQAALDWAARGFRVFPIVENTKRPLIDEWPKQATTDAAQIRRWWQDEIVGIVREYNIGVDTTGMLVVDLDNKDGKNGQLEFERLGGRFDTLTVRTTTGGFHLYYDSAGLDIANSTGAVAEGVDTRGYHGYVLAPGSTLGGQAYSLVSGETLADAPRFIWKRVSLAAPQRRIIDAGADTPASIAAAVHAAQQRAPAIEGLGGDSLTYQTACALRDLGVSESTALEILLEHWNPRCEPPWDAAELAAKVGNAYAYAQRGEGEKSPDVMFGGVVLPAPEYTAKTPANAYPFGNLIPQHLIPARPWLLHRMLLRQEVTALIAPGGVGKSQFILTLAVHFALGTPKIFGFENPHAGKPLRSLIYDGEDPLEEMSMRIHALCHSLGCEPEMIAPYISLNSGKTARLQVTKGRDAPAVNVDQIKQLVDRCNAERVDFISLGPLSKLHDSNENDNTSMGFVMDTLELIARYSNTAMMVQHHTAKPAGASADGFAGQATSARGAKNIIDTVRAAFTLEGISEREAIEAGMSAAEREMYIRIDDAKMNRSLRSAEPTYIQKHSTRLMNGETVGLFLEGTLTPRKNEQTKYLAEMLRAAMPDTATLGMTEAVEVIKRADPMHNEMPDAAVKGRIISMFRYGVELSDGGTLGVKAEGAKKFIAVW
jgi:hypothetical protein